MNKSLKRTACIELFEIEETAEWERAGFSIIQTEAKGSEPIFTDLDYEIVKSSLFELPDIERKIIFLRYWSGCDSSSIAEELGLQAKIIERHLQIASDILKKLCLKHPGFSRTPPDEPMPIAA